MKNLIMLGSLVAMFVSAPAFAATNLIINGSFETGSFSGFQHLNIPTSQPAVAIAYNQTGTYPTGAFGESVPKANAPTDSPDAAGTYGAYFVSDYAKNETLEQLTLFTPGNYEVGFSTYLTYNGFANKVDASFSGEIGGVLVASFVASGEKAGVWKNYSAVATITKAGYYDTQFVFNSNGFPAKDFVIDQVYAISTAAPATVTIPPVPEAATWAMMLVGLGAIGIATRCRPKVGVTYA